MKDNLKGLKNDKIKKNIILIYGIVSLLIVMFFCDYVLTSSYKKNSNTIYMNDNWDIRINDKEHINVSLDNFSFKTVTIGDTIELSSRFPDDWDYENAIMCFHTRQATVEMYVDGKLEYQYGQDRLENGKTVGSGLLYIDIKDEYKGKDLKLALEVSEKNAFSRFDEIFITEWQDLYRHVVTNNRLPMFLGFFFVILGIITEFVSGVAMTSSTKYVNVFWLAKFLVCIGIWTLCYYNCVIIFSLPLYSISLMENIALLLSPVPILGYMRSFVKELKSKAYWIIYNILFVVQTIFTTTFVALHGTDILHVAAILPYFHVLVVGHLFFFSNVMIKRAIQNKMNKKSSKLAYIGPSLVIMFICYDLIEYILNRFTGILLPKFQGGTAIGIVVFITLLVIDIWQKATEQMMEEKEKSLLLKRAYVDGLTAMNNRRYCTEYMSNVQKEGREFSIINFDLNGLKETNDLYGHVKGDILIKKAAEVITDTFSQYGIVGRMGGDEFISIVNTADENVIQSLITNFNKAIEQVNEMEENLNLSIALGYASSFEMDKNDSVEKIYNIADKRMYADKRNYYNEENLDCSDK